MNRSTKLISKLDEVDKPGNITSIHIGDKFELERATVIITDVYITGVHLKEPNTWVKYKYRTTAGKSGEEENTIENFKKNILR